MAAAGTTAYLLAMLATVPATAVIPASAGSGWGAISGTIWHGEAALAGGDRLEWRWAPLRSLTSVAFAADFTVAGPETDLAGRIRLTRDDIRLDSVSGRAAGTLLQTALPDLPFRCDLLMQVDLPTFASGAGGHALAGEIRTSPGSCRPVAGGSPTAIPGLYAVARTAGPNTTDLSIAPVSQRRRTLVRGTLGRGGAIAVTILPAGATLFPFASPPGGLALQTSL